VHSGALYDANLEGPCCARWREWSSWRRECLQDTHPWLIATVFVRPWVVQMGILALFALFAEFALFALFALFAVYALCALFLSALALVQMGLLSKLILLAPHSEAALSAAAKDRLRSLPVSAIEVLPL